MSHPLSRGGSLVDVWLPPRAEAPWPVAPPIKSMNTSSSDAAIGRTPIDRMPCAASAASIVRAPAAAAPAARRTCARSPNDCTSRTPGSEARSSIGGRGRSTVTSSSSPASAACRCAGRSSASRRPSCSSATRPHRSASSRYGVAMTIVSPFDRNSDSSFQNSRRDTGSTPVVGSSRSRIFGSCTSVHASASFCFIPPESRSARRARNGVSWVISSSRSRAAL